MTDSTAIELPEVSVEEHQVREVLKCIVHTILFNRALGHVAPRDMDCQLLNLSYVEVDDAAIEAQVDAGLRAVEGFLVGQKARQAGSARAQQRQLQLQQSQGEPPGLPFAVRLAFFEARRKPGIMRPYVERVTWEAWRIKLRLVDAPPSKADREARQRQLTGGVDAVRTAILHHADSTTETPPVLPGAASPLTYPFEITPEGAAGLADSLLGTVSRIFAGHGGRQPDIMGAT